VKSASGPFKATVLWAAALVAVVVAGLAAVALVNRFVLGPEGLVKDYFALLQEGQGGRALGLLGAAVPAGNPLLLDGEGLRNSVRAVEDFRVVEVDHPDRDTAVVSAEYGVGGESRRTSWQLHRAGKSLLVFDRWAFEPADLPTVRVAADSTSEVTVNGLVSPLAEGTQDFPVFLPAVVEAHFSAEYVQAFAERRVVDSEETARREGLTLTTEPTAKLVGAVQDQLKEYLDGCAAQQVLKPAGCPLAYSTNARVSSSTIKWSITKYPVPEITAFDGGWVVRPLEVGAQLSLVEQDLVTGAYANRTVNQTFSFSAGLKANSAGVRVSPTAGE